MHAIGLCSSVFVPNHLTVMHATAHSHTGFTDYIEFEHSEDTANGSDEESLLFPGGMHPQHEDKNFFRLFTDIWKVPL